NFSIIKHIKMKYQKSIPLWLCVGLFLLFFSFENFAQTTELTQAKGTRVFMQIPDGFEELDSAGVFWHAGSAASIQIKEVPDIASPYTMAAFTKEAIEDNPGVTFLSSEDVTMQS